MTTEAPPVDVAAIRANVEARHVYELDDDGTVLDAVCSCGGGGPCPDREDLLTLAARVEQLDTALRAAHSELYQGIRERALDLIESGLGGQREATKVAALLPLLAEKKQGDRT